MASTLTAPATPKAVPEATTSASARTSPRWRSDPAYQAYLILRTAFVAAPVLFGLDKFFNWMTFWPKYLWAGIPNTLHVTPQHFMYAVGVIEIVAGLLVLALPRFAPWVVAGWLGGIVTNLVIKSIAVGGHTQVYWDVALRDFGLMLAALALTRLASLYAPNPFARRR
ncbi:MAG TPA: hypothetical protein VGS21_05560 [Acidimicrobiales bacterium]|nr:hypothetical protein [Acidimicrobiales bacterium]